MATTFTKQFIMNIPEGKYGYFSAAGEAKMAEMTSTGDIISFEIVNVSPTQKKHIRVFRNKECYDAWISWFQSNLAADFNSYNTNNGITLSNIE